MNAPDEPKTVKTWTLVDNLFKFGCGIIASSALVALSKDRLLKLFSGDIDREYVVNLLGVILLFTVLTLVFRWIFTSSRSMAKFTYGRPSSASCWAVWVP